MWYLYLSEPPVSHLETVLADTPNFSASCSCVRFFSLRHCFKKAPIFFVSISLPLFHLQLTNIYQNYHDIKRESANFQPDIVCLKQINSIFTPKTFYFSINYLSLLCLSISNRINIINHIAHAIKHPIPGLSVLLQSFPAKNPFISIIIMFQENA